MSSDEGDDETLYGHDDVTAGAPLTNPNQLMMNQNPSMMMFPMHMGNIQMVPQPQIHAQDFVVADSQPDYNPPIVSTDGDAITGNNQQILLMSNELKSLKDQLSAISSQEDLLKHYEHKKEKGGNGCFCSYSKLLVIFVILTFLMATYGAVMATMNYMSINECNCAQFEEYDTGTEAFRGLNPHDIFNCNEMSYCLSNITDKLCGTIDDHCELQPITTGNPTGITYDPSTSPSDLPTPSPTISPTANPTSDPTVDPTDIPSSDPTSIPTTDPTGEPTLEPTMNPTTIPTAVPTVNPSVVPTSNPTSSDYDLYLVKPYFHPKSLVLTLSHCQDQGANTINLDDPILVSGSECSAGGAVYFHIETPLRYASYVMYRYTLEGYAYANANKIMDFTWVGYMYTTTHTNFERSSNFALTFMDSYVASNGNMHLRFGPINRYFMGFTLYYQGHHGGSDANIGANVTTGYTIHVRTTSTPL